jgi:hypothetical protein
MLMPRRLGRLAIAVSVLAAGCATTMTSGSHVERGLDFSQYRTYDWGPADALPTGDPRLDQNPFFQDHMLGAVERQLAARGYERAASGEMPDLRIHYHASISRRLDVRAADTRYGSCSGEECVGEITEFEAGTLVLDLVDVRTNRVIWRGWARDSVEGVLDDPDRMEAQINRAVAQMLERLPRPLVAPRRTAQGNSR